MSATATLSTFAAKPETRAHVREIGEAVIDLAAQAARSFIPLRTIGELVADAIGEYVKPAVLAQLDKLIGGDGDPTDELPTTAQQALSQAPEDRAREAVEALEGQDEPQDPTPRPPPLPGRIVRPTGIAARFKVRS